MSKYFTKYLPQKGEIKEGDYYIGGINNIPTKRIAGRDDNMANAKCQKVELFLCSRDIQVGDEFLIDTPGLPMHLEKRICVDVVDPSKYNLDDNVLMYMINKTGAHLKHGECFKVIGEVSPEATWVTEMELEEDQVQFTTKAYTALSGDEPEDFVVSETEWLKEEITKWETIDKRIRILCPNCKTFH